MYRHFRIIDSLSRIPTLKANEHYKVILLDPDYPYPNKKSKLCLYLLIDQETKALHRFLMYRERPWIYVNVTVEQPGSQESRRLISPEGAYQQLVNIDRQFADQVPSSKNVQDNLISPHYENLYLYYSAHVKRLPDRIKALDSFQDLVKYGERLERLSKNELANSKGGKILRILSYLLQHALSSPNEYLSIKRDFETLFQNNGNKERIGKVVTGSLLSHLVDVVQPRPRGWSFLTASSADKTKTYVFLRALFMDDLNTNRINDLMQNLKELTESGKGSVLDGLPRGYSS